MKFLVLIALISVAFAANSTTLPTCGTTNGFTTLGVCQFKQDILCSVLDATDGKCTTCVTGATATSKVCACDGTTSPKNDYTCQAEGTAVLTTCPDGYGSVKGPSDKTRCLACTSGCKACDYTGTALADFGAAWTTALKATCSACHDTGADKGAGTTCGVGTANNKLIHGYGYFPTCPDGYFETAGTPIVCTACLPGCKKCTTATGDCTECAAGHILNAATPKRCIVATATGTDACDASCGSLKCQTTAANCTECATGHVLTAAGKCSRNTIPNCTKYNATDATLCDTCSDTSMISADKKKCDCKSHLKYVKTDYKAGTAASGSTPAVAPVYFKEECAACGINCPEKSTCKPDATDAKNDKCEGASVEVTCADEALKKAACATCGSEDKKCTVCVNAQFKLDADPLKGCVCQDKTVRKGDANECVALGDCDATKCTNGQVCGWNATTSKVECVNAPVASSAAASNGLLLSAISMIAALILA